MISYRGAAVAEIRPLSIAAETFPQRLDRLERVGVIASAEGVAGDFDPIDIRGGALARFLASRK